MSSCTVGSTNLRPLRRFASNTAEVFLDGWIHELAADEMVRVEYG